MTVEGGRILVVGGTRKLGRELALDLERHGASVCVTSRARDARLEEQLAGMRAGAGRIVAATGDAGTARGAAALVAAGAAELGGLDGLVYAASGPFAPARPETLTEAAWDGSFDVIARGFFFAAGAAHGLMAGGGAIVALTDIMGITPWAAFAAHGAAKAAQIHLVRELALAWESDGVRVCGVAPGPLDLEDDERRAATLRAAGGRPERLVRPAEVAAVVRACLEGGVPSGENVVVDPRGPARS